MQQIAETTDKPDGQISPFENSDKTFRKLLQTCETRMASRNIEHSQAVLTLEDAHKTKLMGIDYEIELSRDRIKELEAHKIEANKAHARSIAELQADADADLALLERSGVMFAGGLQAAENMDKKTSN